MCASQALGQRAHALLQAEEIRPFGCRDDLAEQITQQAHILAQRRRLVPARRVHRCPPASAVSKALPVVPNPLLEITSASGVPSVCLIPGYASPSWRSL